MKVFSENRRASFNCEILEKFQAGLVLLGTEVKSIRLGRANLAGSHVALTQFGLELVGCHIPAYQPKNTPSGYLAERPRPLLLKKKELFYLKGRISQKGLTLLPLRIYTDDGKLKLEFALSRVQKKKDKREAIRQKDTEREIREVL